MKKTMSMLLVVVMIFSLMAFAGVAYAQNNSAKPRQTTLQLNTDAFTKLSAQEQYEYLQTLTDEDDITQLLNLLSDEQLQQLLSTLTDEQTADIEKYLKQEKEPQAPEVRAEEPGEPVNENTDPGAAVSEAPEDISFSLTADTGDAADDVTGDTVGDAPADTPEDTPADAAVEPIIDYAAMTPQALYDYLCTLENDAEADAIVFSLPSEQYAAYQAFIAEMMQAVNGPASAFNDTNAAPLKDPVDIVLPKTAKLMGAATASVPSGGQEDALKLSKTVSGTGPNYMLNIEAYATGEVTITPGKPIPADIILVLDTSLSMDENMNSGTIGTVTYTRNSDAYNNRNNIYIKVGNDYLPVTIERVQTNSSSSNPKYQYTYSVSSDARTYQTGTNAASESLPTPSSWGAFYKYPQQITRLNALKSAANSFIDSIETKANEGVDHRIAVVTYSTNASIISGSATAAHAFVDARNNVTGLNTLQSAINNLSSIEYTSADKGLNLAAAIFRNNLPSTSGTRNRVVVFFTDGAPSRGNAGAYQETVANLAVTAAKTLKDPTAQSGCGATIYSIGIFNGANPALPLSSASNENKFMHLVSSNYPAATSMSSSGDGSNKRYYLSASSAGGLNTIFQAISDNIETGGTSVTLDASSVIKDMIAPYFKLPDAVNASGITVSTSTVDSATGQWGPPQSFAGTVSISSDRRTISVSGFNYKDNYYAVIKETGKPDRYKGKKLMIGIPIEYIEHSCIGGLVPTNLDSSAIYSKNSLGNETLVKALPIPEVPIAVNYNYKAVDHSVYLLQSLNGSDLFANTEDYYIPNKINNAYVGIVYTVRDEQNNLLGTFTIPKGADHGTWSPADPAMINLTGNKTYFISCTVTPNSTSIESPTIGKCAYVYVFKPQITYEDSTIYLGETANYGVNFKRAEWINSAANAPALSGPEPALSYSYSPAAGAFVTDTYVNASVLIGGTDVTQYTTFVHRAAPGSAFNPDDGEFIVFVKSCSLTVTKAGAADTTDTFLFTVKNESGLELTVSVKGNGSQTIVGLPVGRYTVAEKSNWSWRYTADSPHIELSRTHSSDKVTISNHVTNNKWLAGDSWAANLFSVKP